MLLIARVTAFTISELLRENQQGGREGVKMMNRFHGTANQQKAFSLFSSQDHNQRSPKSRITNTLQAGFEIEQNLSSGFDEWSCAVVKTTTLEKLIEFICQIKKIK